MNRKTIQLPALFLITLAIALGSCNSKQNTGEHQHEMNSESATATPFDTVKKSIPKEEHAQIGDAHIMVKYHAPAVRGRTIWGGLVPYGEVWVTGAHSATSLEIDNDFSIGDQQIPAGKYALFIIPGKDKWTIIVNKNWEQHLADDYHQKDDVVRLEITPELLENTQERLKYSITQVDNSNASLDISWEKIKASMPIQIK